MSPPVITRRRVAITAIHLVLFSVAYALAFLLRFDFAVPEASVSTALRWMPAAIGIQFLVFGSLRLYQASWRYAGVTDLLHIIRASAISGVLSATAWYFTAPPHSGYPRSVFVLHTLGTIGLVAASRLSFRVLRSLRPLNANGNRSRVLVVGAGDAGEALVREIRKDAHLGYLPVGFVDDDPAKRGSRIHDVPVLGSLESIPRLVPRLGVDEILIAFPSASNERMRQIVGYCKESGARFKTLPGLAELIDGSVSISRMREVKIEDLLGRGAVELDTAAIADFVRGKVVLVTGAGGSIGSELARQVIRHRPAHLLLLEQAENGLFYLLRDLHDPSNAGVETTGLVGDVTDSARIGSIFREYQPDVVFHAAAHKHVPLMEDNLGEAMKNNVLGTATVADAAARAHASAFVLISSDKAVRPLSVMGATKRAAERYVQLLSQRHETKFLSVRFGNVLGSAGSVVPLFTDQIARGGPVTVTHPDMERYFMTIPEAVQLVLQAATMGTDGEVFILEMGKPVKIVDLARDLITLSGFEPEVDIKIEFTGTRPGEKLREELVTLHEHVSRTRHPKILIVDEPEQVPASVARLVEEVRELAAREDVGALRRKLCELVPEYAAHVGAEPEPAPAYGRVISLRN